MLNLFSLLKDVFIKKIPLEVNRSSKWKAVKADHLKLFPTCAACGGKEKVEVHHIKPFHLYPELELEEMNLITLCESRKTLNCHLWVGHLGDYKFYNPKVKKDSECIKEKITNRMTQCH